MVSFLQMGPIYRVLAPAPPKADRVYRHGVSPDGRHVYSGWELFLFHLRWSTHVPLPLQFPIDKADPATWILPLNVAPPILQSHEPHPDAAPAAQPAVDPFGMPLPEQHQPSLHLIGLPVLTSRLRSRCSN